ncbi:hypothetical protein [Yersinia intermedia]|uniref:hypothetical protein n=1 Tax=Yersinia intermedia TaxID=631 RepID=UPI001C96ECF6|nr:hypothetical protein [Yersinia intermedia]
MFHLLVKSRGWEPHTDSVDLGRALTTGYTEKRLADFYKPDGNFSVAQINQIPALFMSEIDGSGEQLARIGRITNATKQPKSVNLTYTFDSAFAPISLDSVSNMAKALGVVDFQLYHSHWAIHDADLFEVMLMHKTGMMPKPNVFNIDELHAPLRNQLSVMMPFAASFGPVYEAIKDMAAELGMVCNRADDIWQHDAIIQDVVSLICKSSVVVCDLSDKNPNVFYEAGIAHALGKRVILIAQHLNDVPFDLRHLRVITYLNNSEGIKKMMPQLHERVGQLMDGLYR